MISGWLRDRRERRYWKVLLARFGVGGIAVRDIVHAPDGEYRVHCRVRSGFPDLACLASQVAVHKRLPAGAICVDEAVDGFVLTGEAG
jgi:hypothetical protein